MRIANNFPALSAFTSLNRTNKSLQKSIKTLSTGLRLNSASDDAAGFAIAEKMRAQLSGLDRAIQNSQDGVSLLQTAEGALGETNSMLLRMRELSLQACNDSLTSQDRQYLQLEIDELKKQIDKIAGTTQFNKKRILDGSSGALWSSSDLNVKAKINGGLTYVDQFGQKISSEGNYRIEVKAKTGQPQVQKTNIMSAIDASTKKVTDSSTARVVFVLDVSGSMGGMLDTIKSNIESFANNIKESGVDNVEIGICTYGTDNASDPNVKAYTYSDGSLWSGSIDEVKAVLAPITAPYSLDTNNYYAVKTVAELYGPTFGTNIVSGSNVIQERYMILVTDIDHVENPFGIPPIPDESEVKAALKGSSSTLEDDIQLSAVCPYTDTTSEFYSLSSDSGGMMLSSSSSSWGRDLTENLAAKIAEDSTASEETYAFPPSPDTKLSNIAGFVSHSGTFLLESPKQITITQGGKSTTITLDASDTLRSLTDKLNDAIGNGLGQSQYTSDLNHFASYVHKATEGTSESVDGTIIVRSAIPGKAGELYFSGDEDLLNALGLNTIQESTETTSTASVYDAHSGNRINEMKAEGQEFKSIIPPEIDIEVDPMTGLIANWDEHTKRFMMVKDDETYSAMIHLKDNGITFQTGANRGEDFMIQLGDTSCDSLGISGINVLTRESASRALSVIDRAINKISSQRAKIGAYQNALEDTMTNLTTTSANVTSAVSRISDADMAYETMNLVKLQILNQSGTSMLSQANQLPKSVMTLMQ